MPAKKRTSRVPRSSGGASSLPDAAAAAVGWLTDPAVEDLHRLDGAPLVWALKKMLLLHSNPLAGEPLLGSLVGYRKLVVGNRDWRLVWRTRLDARGSLTVEIAEVWAVGARSDGAVYSEMTRRVRSLGDTPLRRSLSAILDDLSTRAKGVSAPPPAEPPARPEQWLVDRLVDTAGLDLGTVLAMTGEQAVDAWTDHITGHR